MSLQSIATDRSETRPCSITTDAYGDMTKLRSCFQAECRLTIGVEVELWIRDAKTKRPRGLFDAIYKQLPRDIQENTHPEFLSCQIEYATRPHLSVEDIRRELIEFIDAASAAAARYGAELSWTCIDPTWEFDHSLINDCPRSRWSVRRFGDQARNLATCGLHVHVAVPRNNAIDVVDGLHRFVPLLVALSANSPSMPGRKNQMGSHRAAIWAFEFRNAGFPRLFGGTWDAFESHVGVLLEAQIVESQKDLYSFVRPTRFGTVEVRCCDLPANLDAAMGLAGLIQTLAVCIQADRTFRPPVELLHADLVAATQNGPQGMVTYPGGDRAPAHRLLSRFSQEFQDVCDALGTASAIQNLQQQVHSHAAVPTRSRNHRFERESSIGDRGHRSQQRSFVERSNIDLSPDW